MNPALPGGAIGGTGELDERAWTLSGRLSYTFIPYGRLQQGTALAPNPSELAIDVHLVTAQLQLATPTGTSLDLQLPSGSLRSTSIDGERTDNGIGDLELRVRQSLSRWLGGSRFTNGAALGAVLPTGGYVARSGAANLPPEASYVTLGRGAAWAIAEVDGTYAITPRASAIAQVSARTPLVRTSDDYAWGTEVRGAIGGRARLGGRLSALVLADLQWRDGSTEPDPFGGGRLDSASSGGWQLTLLPGATYALPAGLSVTAGLRIPMVRDVTGQQLVPETGGFVALGYARPIQHARPKAYAPERGTITVVDYWASWCAPCVKIASALDGAAPRWPDVKIVRIDATEWPGDDAPQLPAGVSGLPVVEVYDRDGNRKAMLVGEAASRVVEEVDALRNTERSSP